MTVSIIVFNNILGYNKGKKTEIVYISVACDVDPVSAEVKDSRSCNASHDHPLLIGKKRPRNMDTESESEMSSETYSAMEDSSSTKTLKLISPQAARLVWSLVLAKDASEFSASFLKERNL
ncbi:hypothetical protein HHI36_001528 [Cryptolaemus montrouzieri]|uniref:Uncharacterized protein n=1 Tax=Cryptolaemus montrouzieri TaxID=559131 RepID=A0ABD2P8I4_9CUCU